MNPPLHWLAALACLLTTISAPAFEVTKNVNSGKPPVEKVVIFDKKFACLLDPWGRKAGMTLETAGGGLALHVRGDGFDDTWTWRGSPDLTTPSTIAGTRSGAPLIALTAQDKAPHGE